MVRELDRMGAFNRKVLVVKVLVVATTTGTGRVNPAMIDPLEYMYGGDTAVAAIQHSFLPSWISFIADKAPAQEAGRDLFDAVPLRAWVPPPGAQLGPDCGSSASYIAISGPRSRQGTMARGVLLYLVVAEWVPERQPSPGSVAVDHRSVVVSFIRGPGYRGERR